MTNWNSKRIVFVPGCMLCPGFQAVCSEKNSRWQGTVISTLVQNNIGMVQMPCPEASFGGYINGSLRKPHGIDYYEGLAGFSEYCCLLSKTVVSEIEELLQADYNVLAIIGIEHSPTCAVNYMYTHHGMVKRNGLYMSAIQKEMIKCQIIIPVLGINRSYPDKFVRELYKVFEEKEYAGDKAENIKPE